MRHEKKPTGKYDFLLSLLKQPRVVIGGTVVLAATLYFMTRGNQFGRSITEHGSAHGETGGNATATNTNRTGIFGDWSTTQEVTVGDIALSDNAVVQIGAKNSITSIGGGKK